MRIGKGISIRKRHKAYCGDIIVVLLVVSLMGIIPSCSQETGVDDAAYPPPQNLHIAGFGEDGADRTVYLAWEAPDTERVVIGYVVYKDGDKVAETADTEYQEIIGNNNYDFYVTAIYDSEIESNPSNTVNTGSASDISPVGPGTVKSDGEESNEDSGLIGDDGEERSEDSGFVGDDGEWVDTLSGLCANPYYPVAPGASYTYKVTGTHPRIQTHTITGISEDGFTEKVVQVFATTTYEWICLPEGLVNTREGVMITDTDNVQTSSEVNGVTIPTSISIGDTWTQTYELVSSDGSGEGELHTSLVFNWTAAVIETVTVPAGTYETLRLDYDLEISATLVTYEGHSLPLMVDYNSGSKWLAKGIGLVKRSGGGEIDSMETPEGLSVQISEEFTEVLELMEYSPRR